MRICCQALLFNRFINPMVVPKIFWGFQNPRKHTPVLQPQTFIYHIIQLCNHDVVGALSVSHVIRNCLWCYFREVCTPYLPKATSTALLQWSHTMLLGAVSLSSDSETVSERHTLCKPLSCRWAINEVTKYTLAVLGTLDMVTIVFCAKKVIWFYIKACN